MPIASGPSRIRCALICVVERMGSCVGSRVQGGVDAASESRDHGGVCGVLGELVQPDGDGERDAAIEDVAVVGVVVCDEQGVRFAVVPVEQGKVPRDCADEGVAEIEDAGQRAVVVLQQVLAMEIGMHDTDGVGLGGLDPIRQSDGDAGEVGRSITDGMGIEGRPVERPDRGVKPAVDYALRSVVGGSTNPCVLVDEGTKTLRWDGMESVEELGELLAELGRPRLVVSDWCARKSPGNGARNVFDVDDRPVRNRVPIRN